MEQTLCLRGANFKVRWTLTEAERPDRATWEGRGPAHSYARTSYALAERDGGRTRFEYENEFKAPGRLPRRGREPDADRRRARARGDRSLQRSRRCWRTAASNPRAPARCRRQCSAPQRRFLLCLTALAALCVAVQAITGVTELTLYLTPVFVIGALLLSGRYVGEERIVARWRAAVAVARRPRRTRRAGARAPSSALRSQLLEGSFAVRGPPAGRVGRLTRTSGGGRLTSALARFSEGVTCSAISQIRAARRRGHRRHGDARAPGGSRPPT